MTTETPAQQATGQVKGTIIWGKAGISIEGQPVINIAVQPCEVTADSPILECRELGFGSSLTRWSYTDTAGAFLIDGVPTGRYALLGVQSSPVITVRHLLKDAEGSIVVFKVLAGQVTDLGALNW